MTQPGQAAATADRMAWGRHLQTPLQQFLRTETGSAAVLLPATLGALIWTNVDAGSYDALWGTQISLRLGGFGISQDPHGWVNSGLMTFFFLVIGLEARRESTWANCAGAADSRSRWWPVSAVWPCRSRSSWR